MRKQSQSIRRPIHARQGMSLGYRTGSRSDRIQALDSVPKVIFQREIVDLTLTLESGRYSIYERAPQR